VAVIRAERRGRPYGRRGSSLVRPKYAITPLRGHQEAAGSEVRVGLRLGVAMPGEEAPADARAALDEAVALAAKADVARGHGRLLAQARIRGLRSAEMDLPAGQDD